MPWDLPLIARAASGDPRGIALPAEVKVDGRQAARRAFGHSYHKGTAGPFRPDANCCDTASHKWVLTVKRKADPPAAIFALNVSQMLTTAERLLSNEHMRRN